MGKHVVLKEETAKKLGEAKSIILKRKPLGKITDDFTINVALEFYIARKGV